MIWISHDDMVQNVDFEQLTASDEIAFNLDGGFGRR
jgi:hypothetical protein